MITYGAELNVLSKNGQTPLYWEVKCKDKLAVKLLLEAGADSGLTGQGAQSAYDLAVESGKRDIIQLLKGNRQ